MKYTSNKLRLLTKMTPEQLALLKLIKQEPGITLPDLVSRARSRRLYEKPGDDITTVSHDTYRKKISRALDKLGDFTNPAIPLEKKEGKPTRYTLPADYTFPSQPLDITLAMLLKMSRDVFEPVLPAEYKLMLEEYYEKSEKKIYGIHENTQYSRFLKKLAWHPEGYGNRLIKDFKTYVQPHIIETLSSALFEDRKLKISYESRYQGESKIDVYLPRGLVLRGHILYLVAQKDCPGIQLRHLHLGRIESVEVMDTIESKHHKFNLKEYIEEGAFEKEQSIKYEPVKIKLWIEPYLKEIFLERVPGAKYSEDDKHNIYISFTEKLYPEFMWWLLGFGSGLVVMEPPELVEKIKREINLLSDYYRNH